MTVAELVRNKAKVDDSNPEAVLELVLDGCKIKQLNVEDGIYLSKFSELEMLCLNSTALTSLENFPKLPKLSSLELTDNKLNGNSKLQVVCENCPALTSISLAGNRFEKVTDFDALRNLKELEEVDVELNPANAQKVRTALFEAMPHLKVVDKFDRLGRQVPDTDEDASDSEDDDEEGFSASNDEGADKSSKPKPTSLLKDFYNHEFENDEEDEDEDDFNPDSCSDDDSAVGSEATPEADSDGNDGDIAAGEKRKRGAVEGITSEGTRLKRTRRA